MYDDKDMKIAGSKPSKSIQMARETEELSAELNRAKAEGAIEKARVLGGRMAEQLLNADREAAFGAEAGEDLLQRRNLLAFTVTVGFERFCKNSTISAVAYGSFYDRVKQMSPQVYAEMSDIGVFSFYFLAFRRGGDVERRMGQTFAMLCGKDGDPVYQERGETIYCKFSSVVETAVREMDLQRSFSE